MTWTNYTRAALSSKPLEKMLKDFLIAAAIEVHKH